MTDVDFIRLSALVFATRLIGKTKDPISEGTEMAERLFNKIQEHPADVILSNIIVMDVGEFILAHLF